MRVWWDRGTQSPRSRLHLRKRNFGSSNCPSWRIRRSRQFSRYRSSKPRVSRQNRNANRFPFSAGKEPPENYFHLCPSRWDDGAAQVEEPQQCISRHRCGSTAVPTRHLSNRNRIDRVRSHPVWERLSPSDIPEDAAQTGF